MPRPELAAVQLKHGGPETPFSGPAPLNGQALRSSSNNDTSYKPASSSPKTSNAVPAKLSNSRATAINANFAPLKPSAPSPKIQMVHERKASFSSDLFALAPKVSSPPHKRFFVPRGEERPSSGSKMSERWRKNFENDVKKAAAPPGKDPKVKRAANDRAASSELLLDLEK